MMPELSTEKDRNCRKKTEEGRRFLNLKIRRTRKKKIQHFQTARFDTLSERRWQFEALPTLWQAILGGISVVLLWEIAKLLFKIFSKQVSLSRGSRQEKIDRLKQFANSKDPIERTEGSVEFIFTILRYLFIGNLLWVAPEVFTPVFQIWELELLKFFGVGYFAVGLGWILVYLRIKSSNNANPADAPKVRAAD